MCMTPLVRLMVVFHFLRQALGTQTAPSNPTLLGLGLMMTWFLMAPVVAQIEQQAVEPYRAEKSRAGRRLTEGHSQSSIFWSGTRERRILRCLRMRGK